MDTNGLSNHVTTISGCWFGVWNIVFGFPHIGNVIIPTDGLIFFREIETTNHYHKSIDYLYGCYLDYPPVGHWLATKVFRGVGIPPTRYPIDCLLRISLLYPILTVGGAGSQPNPGIQLNPADAAGNLNVAYRLNVVFLGYLSGWWFQSFFHNVWDNPSHWRTHIFQDCFLTINQLMMFFCFVSRILNKFKSIFNGHFADMMTLSISPVLFDHELSPVWMM